MGRALGEAEAQRDLVLATVLVEPEAEGLANGRNSASGLGPAPARLTW